MSKPNQNTLTILAHIDLIDQMEDLAILDLGGDCNTEEY